MKSRRRGFTLVELLVAISIISVLLMMLAPALRAIRATARRMTCNNNLRQIYMTLHDYSEDYRAHLPYATVLNSPPAYWRQLHNITRDYVLDGHVQYNPDEKWWGYGGGIW